MKIQNLSKKQFSVLKVTLLMSVATILTIIVSSLDFALLAQVAKKNFVPIQQPDVFVVPQSDSPLIISISEMRMVSAIQPEVSFHVTNVSGKSVRAYTVLLETKTEHARFLSSVSSNALSTNWEMPPNQSKMGEFVGQEFSEPVKSLSLSVDYVEFMDGTVWGKDEQNSAEQIAGQRAGGRAAKQYFHSKLKDKSDVEVADLLTQEVNSIITTPSGRSPKWESGFRTGVDVILHRLRAAKAKGNSAEVRRSLEQPYDASEGRRQQ